MGVPSMQLLAAQTLAAGGAFVPTDLPGLALWLDASEASSITASGSAVTAWNDLSGNANHLSLIGGTGPTTGARTIGGLNALEWPGGLERRMQSSAAIEDSTQTWYIVAEADAPAGVVPMSMGVPGSATLGFHPYFNGTGNKIRMVQSAAEISALAGSFPATPVTVVFCLNFGGSEDFQVWLGSTEYTASGSLTDYTPGSTTRAVVGGLNRTSSSFHWDGSIGEILVYTTQHAVAGSERDDVFTYISTKWGVTL